MDYPDIIKKNQEQGVASWINYINQIRLDRLVESLKNEKGNLQNALETIQKTLVTIHEQIVDRNRGGERGVHGFIAEVAECGIGNALRDVVGENHNYEWINNNSAIDLVKNGVQIQQKFYHSEDGLSLQAIREHLKQYPDFLKNGGRYQIARDQYDKICKYLKTSQEEANKLPTSTGEFSLRQWKMVHSLFDSRELSIDDLEPSLFDYSEVQKNAIDSTVQVKEDEIRKINQHRKNSAYEASKSSLQEGAAVTAISAGVEGLTEFTAAVIKKKKSLKTYTEEDWKEVLSAGGIGTLKGGVRGASIYGLTNYTATSAAVASAIVTSSFGVAEQIHSFRNGDITEVEMLEQSEILCLDAAVSALSSFLGQYFIPIPVLGAIIGNSVGLLLYQHAKDYFFSKEEEIIRSYIETIADLDARLSKDYQVFVEGITASFLVYIDALDKAFSDDINEAFWGSIQLAIKTGVPRSEILDSDEKIRDYFIGNS